MEQDEILNNVTRKIVAGTFPTRSRVQMEIDKLRADNENHRMKQERRSLDLRRDRYDEMSKSYSAGTPVPVIKTTQRKVWVCPGCGRNHAENRLNWDRTCYLCRGCNRYYEHPRLGYKHYTAPNGLTEGVQVANFDNVK